MSRGPEGSATPADKHAPSPSHHHVTSRHLTTALWGAKPGIWLEFSKYLWHERDCSLEVAPDRPVRLHSHKSLNSAPSRPLLDLQEVRASPSSLPSELLGTPPWGQGSIQAGEAHWGSWRESHLPKASPVRSWGPSTSYLGVVYFQVCC